MPQGFMRTLRGRLLLGMLAVFAAAMLLSGLFEGPGSARGPQAPLLLPEPYQDALVLAAFALPALALIWLVSSWSLHPLARASRQAASIGPADPDARIDRAGLPAEITPLVDAVNGALDRLADAAAAERRFTENAAHELRTPLAVLTLRLQRAKASPPAALDWPAIERDLAHMNRLLGRLLALARAEHATRSEPAEVLVPVNLARLAREAAAMILPVLEAQGRGLILDLPEALSVRGEASELREAIGALMENAAQHGQGEVRLAARSDGAAVRLSVTDAGLGVAPGQEAQVFERFHKSAASAGSGLGLSIVREVIRRHGGSVAVRGACFEIGLRAPDGAQVGVRAGVPEGGPEGVPEGVPLGVPYDASGVTRPDSVSHGHVADGASRGNVADGAFRGNVADGACRADASDGAS